MKKVCFVFVLLLVGSVALAQTRMVRLTRYEGWPITGVSASGAFDAFDVWLIRSDETRAVVEINEQLEPMLRFEIDSCGVVHVGMDGIRGDIHDVRWRLYLYLNDLTYIRASGASDVDCVGLFESGDVRIELGGASDLRGLELAAAGVVSIEARESSDIDASVRCRELNGTFSGASDAVLSGFSGNLYCNLSGDSDMKVSGTAGIVSVKCSGVSDFDGAGLVTQSCRAEASAASRIALGPVEKELSANSSGVSSITYRGNPSLGSVVHSSTSSVRQVH
ncbi:GIN domain-containing protein [Alistipes ihumii]|uniref:GIN domain-containing protein n=1 Tax=Alistipes ihumii TaxID=1470347 RepID=UPI002670DA98|nr:DUF2807 domain-containing protein [Alistipes ihumii]